jgi:hypothetical protein
MNVCQTHVSTMELVSIASMDTTANASEDLQVFLNGSFNKNSQTCEQRPPLGPPKSGRCSEGGHCSKVSPKY